MRRTRLANKQAGGDDRRRGQLARAVYRYREGWEDEALDVVMGLQVSLKDMLEYVEWMMGEKWVDFNEMELEAIP